MKYDLYLRGYVGGADFDAALVSRTLDRYRDRGVTVLIDSLGGSLATALSIASAFRDHGDVTVHFVGMNASAATIASMGAKTVTMDASAMYLVHKCSATFFQWASLNADELQSEIDHLEQMKTDLEKHDLNVARMYARKCKKSVEDLLALMKTGGWLTAQEALQWGFVDSVTDYTEDAVTVLTEDVAASMRANGIPLPDMPVQTAHGALERLVETLAGFFQRKETNPKNQKDMKKLLPFLAMALAMQTEEFELKDESLALTSAQCDTLEAFLKGLKEKHDKAVKDLADKQAEVEALRKQLSEQPADETQRVINANRHEDPLTPEAEFAQTFASAKALFDSLP